jgi:hypothetical protein
MAVAAPEEARQAVDEHAVALELSRLLRISTRFARALTLRFAERSADNAHLDRPELAEAVAATREWRIIPFPPLPPAPLQGFPQEELKPDLLIAGIGQRHRWLFQLIVEVKLTTPLEQLWVNGRRVAQPAAYAAVWDQIQVKDAAELRYLGTLSPPAQSDWLADFDGLAPAHVRPARDVHWEPELALTVRQALSEMSAGERDRFLPELRHFQASLRGAAPELELRLGGGARRVALAAASLRRSRAAARTR